MCAQSCFDTVHTTGYHHFSRCWRPVSMALRSGSSLLTVDDAHWTRPRFFKVATGSESSGDGFGVLEDERCIDTGKRSSSNATSCTSCFSPAARLRRRASQISHTILTQAEWCAIRAVTRLELELLTAIKTAETGARVYWH